MIGNIVKFWNLEASVKKKHRSCVNPCYEIWAFIGRNAVIDWQITWTPARAVPAFPVHHHLPAWFGQMVFEQAEKTVRWSGRREQSSVPRAAAKRWEQPRVLIPAATSSVQQGPSSESVWREGHARSWHVNVTRDDLICRQGNRPRDESRRVIQRSAS